MFPYKDPLRRKANSATHPLRTPSTSSRLGVHDAQSLTVAIAQLCACIGYASRGWRPLLCPLTVSRIISMTAFSKTQTACRIPRGGCMAATVGLLEGRWAAATSSLISE